MWGWEDCGWTGLVGRVSERWGGRRGQKETPKERVVIRRFSELE